MGFYIEVTENKRKAKQLIFLYGATRISVPTYPPPPGEVIICVVDNGPYEAVAICYSEQEMQEFNDPDDDRRKEWLLMDRKEVIDLCPNVENFLQ